LSEHKGHISNLSLRNALGDDVPQSEIDSMITAADNDGDHLVTFSDIVNLWHQVWNIDVADQSGNNAGFNVSFSGRYK
jgi:Ca2+-binding EF-hand superfamily protein